MGVGCLRVLYTWVWVPAPHLGQQGLSSAGLAVQDDPLGRLDADILIQLRVRQGELHSLLDLLNLLRGAESKHTSECEKV